MLQFWRCLTNQGTADPSGCARSLPFRGDSYQARGILGRLPRLLIGSVVNPLIA